MNLNQNTLTRMHKKLVFFIRFIEKKSWNLLLFYIRHLSLGYLWPHRQVWGVCDFDLSLRAELVKVCEIWCWIFSGLNISSVWQRWLSLKTTQYHNEISNKNKHPKQRGTLNIVYSLRRMVEEDIETSLYVSIIDDYLCKPTTNSDSKKTLRSRFTVYLPAWICSFFA